VGRRTPIGDPSGKVCGFRRGKQFVQVGNGAFLCNALSEERPAHSTRTEEIILRIYRHERGPRLVEIEAGGREGGICRFGIEGRAILWIASRNAKYSMFQAVSWFRERRKWGF
jgi:hypothetical protein